VHSTHNRQNAEDMEHEAATTEERSGVRTGKEEEGHRCATARAERLVTYRSNKKSKH
jgi:hypothetical protein